MASFGELRAVNVSRKNRWHAGSDGWLGSDWATAMAGECGEACNIVKKMRRLDNGIRNLGDPPRVELLMMLGKEIADTIIYADLLAAHYGIDLDSFVTLKFNEVSRKFDFPERL